MPKYPSKASVKAVKTNLHERSVAREALSRAKGKVIGTGGKGAIAIRFDDDPLTFYNSIYPTMALLKLPGCFALLSDFKNQYPGATCDMIKTMYWNGIEIWCHGYDHQDYANDQEMYNNIVTAKSVIENMVSEADGTPLGLKVQGFITPGIVGTFKKAEEPYDGILGYAPIVPPTVTAVNDPTSTLPVGTYYVSHSFANTNKNTESTVSAQVAVTIGTGQAISTQIVKYPSGINTANVYISTVNGTTGTKQGSTTNRSFIKNTALVAGTAAPVVSSINMEDRYKGDAGKLIMDTYPLSEGSVGLAKRQLPTGPYHGADHITATSGMTLAQLKAAVDDVCRSVGSNPIGLEIMFHPQDIGGAGKINMDDVKAILYYIASKRNAGKLDVLTPSGLYFADPTTSNRMDLMTDGSFENCSINTSTWAVVNNEIGQNAPYNTGSSTWQNKQIITTGGADGGYFCRMVNADGSTKDTNLSQQTLFDLAKMGVAGESFMLEFYAKQSSSTNNQAKPRFLVQNSYASSQRMFDYQPVIRTLADPTTAPTVTASGTGFTAPTGNSSWCYAWMDASGALTLPSPSQAFNVAQADTLTITVPVFPTGAVAAVIFGGTSAGSETVQGIITASGTSFLKKTALVSGLGALPVVNGTTGTAWKKYRQPFCIPSTIGSATVMFCNAVATAAFDPADIDGIRLVKI